MYYHTQKLKYVNYGKIYPAPLGAIDEYFLKPYQWLGKYCGYSPQIWLGRGKTAITGYKSKYKQKGSKYSGARRNFEPNVMFTFDIIKGFPVDYDLWCSILNPLIGCEDPVRHGDDAIKKSFEEWHNDCKKDNIEITPNSELWKWVSSSSYEDFLNRYLFVENDQVVVPSLNLKAAKQVFCRNEKQVKVLRHMGFINDRIKILNSKQWD